MRVLSFGRDELIARLRAVRLEGHGQPHVYEHADIDLAVYDPDELVPAQRYVLASTVARIKRLAAVLRVRGIDLFALDGGLWVDGVPVIPPVVEVGPDGPLINDGIHRVCAARELGRAITVVEVRGVPYPYYAHPLRWDAVRPYADVLDVPVKKEYREPHDPRALRRDFNAPFPGVQAERPAAPARAGRTSRIPPQAVVSRTFDPTR